jgi:hypothetical protein
MVGGTSRRGWSDPQAALRIADFFGQDGHIGSRPRA